MDTKNINIEEFTYTLPNERIAKYPLKERDMSKLLIFNKGDISEDLFKNISSYLPEGSLLVANNTKVIRARMEFFKDTGARIEIFVLEPHTPADYSVNFSTNTDCKWYCIVGNLKKWKNGILKKELTINGSTIELCAEISEKKSDSVVVKFSWNNEDFTFSDILEHSGNIPIPPYLNRESEESDTLTYQTIYSKHKGSVAAPTAGLHFTERVFNSIKSMGIEQHEVTLHVGAGTFKPVKTDVIGKHEMHTEHFIITPETIPPLLKNINNITAVGTTTVRTLESLYWLGVKLITQENGSNILHLNQWDAYELPQEVKVEDALNTLHNFIISSGRAYFEASTAIMIAPGYVFKLVNRIVTNFHQPGSTLLLLIGAFVGEKWKDIYKYALDNDFRFLSYGDSCLLM